MSRVGKKPIILPSEVEVRIEKTKITVKGPKGELEREIRPEITVKNENNILFFNPVKETKTSRALWGLTRSLVNNMIKGVSEGYVTKLQIEGIGYKAFLEGKDLLLQVGFSHPVKIMAEKEISFSVEKNIISVSGIDKGLVTQLAAKIKRIKPPEPYKGKGIRYVGEIIKKKATKKVVGK